MSPAYDILEAFRGLSGREIEYGLRKALARISAPAEVLALRRLLPDEQIDALFRDERRGGFTPGFLRLLEDTLRTIESEQRSKWEA